MTQTTLAHDILQTISLTVESLDAICKQVDDNRRREVTIAFIAGVLDAVYESGRKRAERENNASEALDMLRAISYQLARGRATTAQTLFDELIKLLDVKEPKDEVQGKS